MVIQKTPTKIDKIVSLKIGQHQENAATQIKMDVSDWITVHPTAGFHILFKRPGEVQAQPVLSSLEEGILTWTVQEWETSLIGVGYAEVRAIEAESALVAKSRVIPCSVEESVIEDGEVPPEYSGWVERILNVADLADDLEQSIADGIEDIQAEGATQVGNVNTAGTTQVGAVQAKGTEVLNNIPADYSTLSGDVTDLKSAVNVIDGFFDTDIKGVATKTENTYIDAIGTPHHSVNWTTFYFDAEDISLIKTVKTSVNSGNEKFYQVSFFSSSTPSNTDLIGGVRFGASGDITHTDISIPENAVLCCVVDRSQSTDTAIISGIVTQNIAVTQSRVKEIIEENEDNTIISAVTSAITNGEFEYQPLGKYFLTVDGVASASNYWEIHKYPVQSGSKIHLSTWLNAIATAGTPKCAYAFIGKDYSEITTYNSWIASDVISVSPVYSGIDGSVFEYDIACPEGAKTLVVTIGSVGASNGIDTEISTYAKRNCTPRLNSTMLEAVSASVDKTGVPFIYTFTETFSITPDTPFNICMLMSIDAKYSGTDAPSVSYEYSGMYTSMSYTIGENERYRKTEIRIAPKLKTNLVVTFTVPTGTTLYIRGLDFSVDSNPKLADSGIRLDAHRGFFGFCPHDTISAFEYAAICGYPACITIPKATLGGTQLVCIHDDTINATALTSSGGTIPETVTVSRTSYADLLAYDYSRGYDEYWRGQKLPTVEEFFEICAKTGMKPMFSTHPALTVEQWQSVKSMLLRYNLLKDFTVKSFELSILETAYSVFGSEIDAYIWDNGVLADMQSSTVGNATCRKGIELQASTWTAETATNVINAGYFASAWNVGRISSDEYMRLIRMGVSEFTDDYNCSSGLNW